MHSISYQTDSEQFSSSVLCSLPTQMVVRRAAKQASWEARSARPAHCSSVTILTSKCAHWVYDFCSTSVHILLYDK